MMEKKGKGEHEDRKGKAPGAPKFVIDPMPLPKPATCEFVSNEKTILCDATNFENSENGY